MKPKVVHINEKDSAVISLFPIKKGDEVAMPDGEVIVAREDIPQSHKMAIMDIKKGETIYKYGEDIGTAAVDIPKGGWIHAQHMAGSEGFAAAVEQSLKGKG
ncbi:MAG: UxaA family hydrolase [Clostridiales Family XIII bacterium]|nr:UxaA family hydrolase [Clostridiales Family XIII bacterium]